MIDENLLNIELFSDGCAEPNPGKGAYATILRHEKYEKIFTQGYIHTTNNRMELMGVIRGLNEIKKKCNVTVTTDSQYVINGIEKGWAKNWRNKNWMKKPTKKVLNSDLWKQLLLLTEYHNITFKWIKGHSGHIENELCDSIANKTLNSNELITDEGYINEIETKILNDKNKYSNTLFDE